MVNNVVMIVKSAASGSVDHQVTTLNVITNLGPLCRMIELVSNGITFVMVVLPLPLLVILLVLFGLVILMQSF